MTAEELYNQARTSRPYLPEWSSLELKDIRKWLKLANTIEQKVSDLSGETYRVSKNNG